MGTTIVLFDIIDTPSRVARVAAAKYLRFRRNSPALNAAAGEGNAECEENFEAGVGGVRPACRRKEGARGSSLPARRARYAQLGGGVAGATLALGGGILRRHDAPDHSRCVRGGRLLVTLGQSHANLPVFPNQKHE